MKDNKYEISVCTSNQSIDAGRLLSGPALPNFVKQRALRGNARVALSLGYRSSVICHLSSVISFELRRE
jgi:hypothetical protein